MASRKDLTQQSDAISLDFFLSTLEKNAYLRVYLFLGISLTFNQLLEDKKRIIYSYSQNKAAQLFLESALGMKSRKTWFLHAVVKKILRKIPLLKGISKHAERMEEIAAAMPKHIPKKQLAETLEKTIAGSILYGFDPLSNIDILNLLFLIETDNNVYIRPHQHFLYIRDHVEKILKDLIKGYPPRIRIRIEKNAQTSWDTSQIAWAQEYPSLSSPAYALHMINILFMFFFLKILVDYPIVITSPFALVILGLCITNTILVNNTRQSLSPSSHKAQLLRDYFALKGVTLDEHLQPLLTKITDAKLKTKLLPVVYKVFTEKCVTATAAIHIPLTAYSPMPPPIEKKSGSKWTPRLFSNSSDFEYIKAQPNLESMARKEIKYPPENESFMLKVVRYQKFFLLFNFTLSLKKKIDSLKDKTDQERVFKKIQDPDNLSLTKEALENVPIRGKIKLPGTELRICATEITQVDLTQHGLDKITQYIFTHLLTDHDSTLHYKKSAGKKQTTPFPR